MGASRLLLASVVALGLGCGPAGGAGSDPVVPASAEVETRAPLSRARLTAGMHLFDVEVADTPEQKTRGLGGHAPLGPSEGMIFPYRRPGLYGFWMKDMLFDIDIVWIRGDRIVGVSHEIPHETGAGPLPVHRPPEPADLILEVAAGTARAKGLEPGVPIRVEPDPRQR